MNSVLVTVTIFTHGIVSQGAAPAATANLSGGQSGGVNSGLSSVPALGVTPPVAPGPGPLSRVGRDAALGDQDVELSFQDIPEFVSANNTQTVEEGQNTTLSCQVNKLGSWQMIWYRRHKENDIDWKILRIGDTGVVIKKDDQRYHFEDGSTVLRISNVQHEDEGLYKCEIAVKDPPRIYVEMIVTPPGGIVAGNPARTWTSDASATLPPNVAPMIVALLFFKLF